MRKIFRKAMTIAGSAALIGMTVGAAAAASYPAPFTSNAAVVVGASAAPSDNVAAGSIVSNLDSLSSGSTVTLEGASGVTEEEVVLGGQIDASGSEVESTLTENDLPSLLDEKFSWDDGNGADDHDVHEAIIIGDMAVLTSFNDEELEGVAISNNEGLEYRYYFDDALNTTALNAGDGDTLYLTIMGKQYEVQSMSATSIGVVTSEEISLSIGESVTVDGKVFTVDDVFDGKAQINGEIINENSAEKVDGMQVRVEDALYHSNSPELSKVIVKIGEDISKTFSDGDEYIGEDEDDPLWVWTFSDPTSDGGYIGVKYNANINDADDEIAGDSIKYAGAGYIMP